MPIDALAKPAPRTALIIPTLNAGALGDQLIAALATQRFKVDRFIVLDSQSTDGTADRFRAAGATVIEVERANFDHGGTRQQGVELCPDAEIVILLTQDAVPADDETIGRIVEVFADPQVASAYGRQLPRPGSGAIEAFARIFNYPPVSATVTASAALGMGIRATFSSNSFSAYRRSALKDVGGFPSGTILGEDVIVTARLLAAGWSKAYASEAMVYHSHDYSILEEARRYFDIGVLHAREHWILTKFGRAEGEGVAFLKAQFAYLLRHDPLAIPGAAVRILMKYAAYRLGQSEASLPTSLKLKVSMSPRFWKRAAQAK